MTMNAPAAGGDDQMGKSSKVRNVLENKVYPWFKMWHPDNITSYDTATRVAAISGVVAACVYNLIPALIIG